MVSLPRGRVHPLAPGLLGPVLVLCAGVVAVVRAAPAGAAAPSPEAAAPAPTDRYFPFRLGDSWTYDWRVEGPRGPAQTLSRTRTFEGTEFVGGGVAFKLVSDDGTYHVYTLRSGKLQIHSSSEAGHVLYYDPPLVLFAPDLKAGKPRPTDNPETQRKWKTTLVGYEDVTVSLGTFKDCLKIRVEMEAPDHVSDSYHYFAPGVGLVAYQYDLLTPDRRTHEIKVDARLRLARLSGMRIASMADIEKLAQAGTLSLGGQDDPSARAVLRRATDNRYTWDEKFPGFHGNFEYKEEGKPSAVGSFEVDRALNVRVTTPTEAARAQVRSQISSFCNHRKHNPFDLVYAGASFKKGATLPDGAAEILAEGDTMGTTYTVRKDEILSVGRSAGRLRFVADNREQLRTEDGRYITVVYDLTYYSNEDQSPVSREQMEDSYAKVGPYWLPTGRRTTRSERGKVTSSFVLRLSRLEHF